jgi:hypothetical protein
MVESNDRFGQGGAVTRGISRFGIAAVVLLAACGEPAVPPELPALEPRPVEHPVAAAAGYGRVPRLDFNRLAAELALPLFWAADEDRDATLDPAELAVTWGLGDTPRSHWVTATGFSAAFDSAYRSLVERHQRGPSFAGLDARETARRKLVLRELSQGFPTLLRTSFAKASEEDRAIASNIVAAAVIIERLHARQTGALTLQDQLLSDDPASRMLFHRNQGPWCEAPETKNEATCNALPSLPKRISGLYPPALQEQKDFCDALKQKPDAEKLRHQFHVVEGGADRLEAVPYHRAYAEDMRAVSAKLRAAAEAVVSPDEAPFKKYLLDAAQAFLDDSWFNADRSWAAMNVKNSKWYLRIGPDEVYFEPCNLKAGFHVSFARINQDSLSLQEKLDPVKREMEQTLAKLAGKPYRARKVEFRLPDFIDIVLNAGDSRSAHGATIGQSLPNWGPVAEKGGRTVAMTNLYTDPDSVSMRRSQAASLLCSDAVKSFSAEPGSMTLSTVLHEAAHNLGPAHEYKVRGKKDDDIFGGPLASTLEELKAQTAALFFTSWLVERKLIDRTAADRSHTGDIVWSFGHISRGMYNASGNPEPYSQLAAIQVGYLRQAGALEWRPNEKAANGKDTGCVSLKLDKFPSAVEGLMKEVASIKASGDKERAVKLVKDFVDVSDDKKRLLDTIRTRWLRAPKASFVYAIEM